MENDKKDCGAVNLIRVVRDMVVDGKTRRKLFENAVDDFDDFKDIVGDKVEIKDFKVVVGKRIEKNIGAEKNG